MLNILDNYLRLRIADGKKFALILDFAEALHPLEISPTCRLTTALRNDRLATRKLELPAPDPSGGIPMWIEETKQPGNYALKITVVQGLNSTDRSLAYTIAGT